MSVILDHSTDDSVDNEDGTGPAYVCGPEMGCLDCKATVRTRYGFDWYSQACVLECRECLNVLIEEY